MSVSHKKWMDAAKNIDAIMHSIGGELYSDKMEELQSMKDFFMKSAGDAKVTTGFVISENDGEYSINDVLINDDTFEECGYAIVEVEDEINNLQPMYAEAILDLDREDDANSMKEALKYLESTNDKYILSSRSSGGDFLLASDTPQRFMEVCAELIEASTPINTMKP